MTYIEFGFFIFLAITTIVFYLFPVNKRWWVLLGSSIVFYGIAGIKYLPFIFVTSFSIYLAGRKMGQIYEQMNQDLEDEALDRKAKKAIKEAAKARCKKYLVGLLLLNVGILVVVKFTKFFVGPINSLLAAVGGNGEFSAAMIIVPLGISYYTFSCLSYLLDVYWKRVDYEPNYARFLLYAIYFPHILQGPIERYGKLGQRLKGEFRWDYDRVCKGLQLMLWGFFKKLVIADRINIFNDAVYAEGNVNGAGGVIYILAIFLDVVYIYADFSGCMDIARGASQIFGVEMDLNFDHPFASKSIVEFWRHWHMSLGSWFKDYVYYPVSTSTLVKNLTKACRKKLPDSVTRCVVTFIPVFCTWFLTGLWHGTGLPYVCWGIYYAIMIFISVSFEDVLQSWNKALHINTEAWSWKLFQTVRTTCIFAGGRFLTRPGTLRTTARAAKSILTTINPWVLTNGHILDFGLDGLNILLLMACLVLFGFVSYYQIHVGSVREWIGQQNFLFRWFIYLVAIFSILIFGIYGTGYDASAFVYMAY